MNPNITKRLLLLICLLMFLPAPIVLADTGPKPTMDFEFRQEFAGEPVTIVSGILYECDQSDCSDGAPIEEVGPQGFRCQANACSAVGYGFAPYHRIEIQFSDGQTRQSNIFETAGFNSKYTVTVRPDDLLVEAQFGPATLLPTGIVIVACLCMLVVLGLVVGLVVFLVRRSRKN
jgi:hypothetical protein